MGEGQGAIATMGRLPSQKALAATLDRCENAGHGGHAPIDEVKDFLRLCRDGKVRLPEQIARHGLRLVKSKEAKRKLNDTELWLINEQVCYALLDTGEIDEATMIVKTPLLRGQGSRGRRKGREDPEGVPGRVLHRRGGLGGACFLVPVPLHAEASQLLLRGVRVDPAAEPVVPPQVRRLPLLAFHAVNAPLGATSGGILQRRAGFDQRVERPRQVWVAVLPGRH